MSFCEFYYLLNPLNTDRSLDMLRGIRQIHSIKMFPFIRKHLAIVNCPQLVDATSNWGAFFKTKDELDSF